MPPDSETIYALSSAMGRAGVSVVRISGPGALEVAAKLAPSVSIRPRFAHRARLIDPADGSLIDDGLVLTFPAPRSFTGESVAEFQVHGSPAVLNRVFAVLSGLGLTAAERGEFTRRAFANGKLDLTEAEGLADLIAADSEAQRVQALQQMGGAWSEHINDWHLRLLDALAWLEASIDFADEDDVPSDVAAGATDLLKGVCAEMATVLSAPTGEIVRDGLRVAIIGLPNVGKSTLMNRLVKRDVAIVSDIPGTTRDVIDVRLDLGGYVVVLSDMAGLRVTEDVIEAEGIRRARRAAAEADMRLVVVDAHTDSHIGLETEFLQPGDLMVLNKSDLKPSMGKGTQSVGVETLRVSALTGYGLEELIDALRVRVAERASMGEGGLITRRRHRDALSVAFLALQRAVGATPDLAAEDVRVALRSLSRIVGRFDVEDVLDRVFGEFCIGK